MSLMRPLVIAGTLTLLFTASVFGQTRVTAQQIGDFTYYSGTAQGERLSGSSQRIGDFTSRYTTQHIGSFSACLPGSTPAPPDH